MANYSFVLGNAVVILLMAIGMGFLGGAETFTPDGVVIGDADELVASGEVSNVSEVDFDTDRLLYQPDFESFETPDTEFRGYVWNGQGSNGTITYDVSGVDSAVVISREPGLIPGINLDNLFLLKDGQKEQVTSTTHFTDLSGTSALQIVLTAEESEFLGFEESTLALEDATDSSNMRKISYTVQEGFFATVTNYIGYAFVGAVEVFSVLRAWFEFVYVMPGLIGWFMKGYIGAFIAYFIVAEIWLG